MKKGELPPLHHIIKMCNAIFAKIAFDLCNDFARVTIGKCQVAGITEEATQADHAVHAVINSAKSAGCGFTANAEDGPLDVVDQDIGIGVAGSSKIGEIGGVGSHRVEPPGM